VLLIDDDLVSREVTATVLTMVGYEVHTAEDGLAALAFLEMEEAAPEVILMDAQMPGLSGAGLIAEMRARSRASIVAVSASQPPAEVTDAADGFLLKPLDAEKLSKLIDGLEFKPDAAPDIPPNAPVISVEILEQLRQLMPERAVREIYAAIVSDLARRAMALDMAIASNDEAEVHRIGHAIKGGCAMAGAQQASRLGALIETARLDSRGNQFDNILVLLNDLRLAARALERMLDSELPTRPKAS
jgi:CheY-like chemotaxis protein